jgi:hypothetical protein
MALISMQKGMNREQWQQTDPAILNYYPFEYLEATALLDGR